MSPMTTAVDVSAIVEFKNLLLLQLYLRRQDRRGVFPENLAHSPPSISTLALTINPCVTANFPLPQTSSVPFSPKHSLCSLYPIQCATSASHEMASLTGKDVLRHPMLALLALVLTLHSDPVMHITVVALAEVCRRLLNLLLSRWASYFDANSRTAINDTGSASEQVPLFPRVACAGLPQFTTHIAKMISRARFLVDSDSPELFSTRTAMARISNKSPVEWEGMSVRYVVASRSEFNDPLTPVTSLPSFMVGNI